MFPTLLDACWRKRSVIEGSLGDDHIGLVAAVSIHVVLDLLLRSFLTCTSLCTLIKWSMVCLLTLIKLR